MGKKRIFSDSRNRREAIRESARRRSLNEVVDINGSKVFVENGEVKTVLNENIQRTGYMSVEEMCSLICAKIKKMYELNGKL